MDDRAVVALVVVLAQDLPVRLGLVLVAVAPDEPVGREPGQVGEVGGYLGERRPVGRQGQVEEPVHRVDTHRDQAGARGVEVVVHVRRADEPAVEPVGPGVVRALEDLRPAGAFVDDPGPAVTADVVEGGESRRAAGRGRTVRAGALFPRPGPDRDNRLAADLAGHEAARFVQLLEPTSAHPHAGEDALNLLVEDRGVGVEPAVQWPGRLARDHGPILALLMRHHPAAERLRIRRRRPCESGDSACPPARSRHGA